MSSGATCCDFDPPPNDPEYAGRDWCGWYTRVTDHDPFRFTTYYDTQGGHVICPKCGWNQSVALVVPPHRCTKCGHKEKQNE